jgi:hypothetical protein
MRMSFRVVAVGALCSMAYGMVCLAVVSARAQETEPAAAQETALAHAGSPVPGLVRYAGELDTRKGERVALRFSVYGSANGGSALWSESQSVTVGNDGKYSVLLGAGSSIGLPASVFAAGEMLWLGVQVGAGPELARTALVSVPYAMKAGDAETLSGHAVAEFVTQEELRGLVAAQLAAQQLAGRVQPLTTTPITPTGSGTANYLPLWTSSGVLGTSAVYQVGTGASVKIGIGTSSPTATLNVVGGTIAQGTLNMLATGSATSTAVVNSPLIEMTGSAYNSSTSAAVLQKFGWEVLPTGNNTASPSANLALLYGTGTPVATGLSIAPTGIITFASGQTFPGAGSGTAAVVNATSYDLNGTRFDYGNQSNQFLAFAGNGSAGTGTSNIAVGNSSLNALTSGSSNASVGFATLTNTTTGSSNTAVGTVALEFNTTGSNNVGVGGAALVRNTTGNYNTGVGQAALANNVTGLYNTAVGYNAGPDSSSSALAGSTAIGYGAVVSASNALVLGQTTAGSPGATGVNVGVGTATPVSSLELSKNVEDGMGPVLTLTNGGGTSGASGYHPATTAIDFKTYLHSSTANSPTSRIEAVDDDYGNGISFYTKLYGSDSNKLVDQVDIGSGFDDAMYVNGFLNVCCDYGISSDPPTIADIGGSLEVDGNINAIVQNVRMDHPLDPANKTLTQTAVASSEQMNLYSGNVTTDALGLATIKLPEWFEAENGDFRYQLTTIGRDAHAWVAEEVGNHQFKIATNATFVKVSWQITAVRQDAYAKAHPLVAEKEKPAAERGYYLHPELYGQSWEKQVRWARHPRELAKRRAAKAVVAGK